MIDETFQSGDKVSFIHPETKKPVNGILIHPYTRWGFYQVQTDDGKVHVVHHRPLKPSVKAMAATELSYKYYTCSKMVDYFEDNQPFPSEENEALLELLTYELDEVYK